MKTNPIIYAFTVTIVGAVISILAGVCGSRPIIDGTRIPVHAILRRINAGETIDFIADDYDLNPELVKRVQLYGERRAA